MELVPEHHSMSVRNTTKLDDARFRSIVNNVTEIILVLVHASLFFRWDPCPYHFSSLPDDISMMNGSLFPFLCLYRTFGSVGRSLVVPSLGGPISSCCCVFFSALFGSDDAMQSIGASGVIIPFPRALCHICHFSLPA